MFQLLKESHFDFMGRGKAFVVVSLVLMALSIGVLSVHGLNLGIEFTGGTELQLKYVAKPDIGAVRDALKAAGMTSQVVTTIGDPADNEVYIRLGSAVVGEEEEDLTSRVSGALRGSARDPGTIDLNVADKVTLAQTLSRMPGMGASEAAGIAARITDNRKEVAVYSSFDELASIEGATAGVLDYLREHAVLGPLAIRSQSYIGPAVGRELLNKALLAIVGSLIGMLLYIWVRFQFQWGFAAVVALTHDTVIVLGLFSLFGKELSLPVVAAFLTLVGYSVNDTVVVFDRIRENLRNRAASTLQDTINLSINQTLSRTVITSGLTWLVVVALLLFGGAALNAFAFVLTAGVVVGTYSSIYIASPILVLWQQFLRGRGASAVAGGSAATPRRAKKIRTHS